MGEVKGGPSERTGNEDEDADETSVSTLPKEPEEPPLQDILADTRRTYNAQQEFVYLLYNDIREIFLPQWNGHVLRKTVFPITREDEGLGEGNEREGYEEQYFETQTRSYGKGDEVPNRDPNLKQVHLLASQGKKGQVVEGKQVAKEGLSTEPTEPSQAGEEDVEEPPDWRLHLPDEYVEIDFFNKNTYAGRVSRRQMEGDGIYHWRHGAQYKGQFEENMIQGKGFLEWNDATSWYEGDFHQGYRHGNGTMVSKGYNRMYIGNWYMGRKHGKGYCRYENGDFYDGEWNMDEREGVGYRLYPSGARYVGHWKNNLRYGIGTMIWPNGDIYRGEWKNGAICGYGEYTWDGFFNKSLSWPQENCYMGEWRCGMRHGTGVLKLNTIGGAKYSGEWYKDMKHGYGMIIGNNGGLTEGDPLFVNNVLIPLNPDNVKLGSDGKYHMIGMGSDTENNDAREFLVKPDKIPDPRSTSVLKPEQRPSLWFHIYRLLEPERLWPLSVLTIPSGKCRICGESSTCSCLYEPPVPEEPKESSAMVSHFFDNSSSSVSKFCKNGNGRQEPGKRDTKFMGLTELQHEERWIYNCFITHMPRLREIYRMYAELFCVEPPKVHLSMSRIALWQLWRDCKIHEKMSLVEIDRHIAFNKSTFVEEAHCPFERIEIWQFLHALIEVSWHMYTKLGDIETVKIRGQLAGGLYKLLVDDIFPNAGNNIGTVSSTNRDLLPLYSVYQLYREVGEPHSAKQLLWATCTMKDFPDPEPLPWPPPSTSAIPDFRLYGMNAVTVGERLSYIPGEEPFLQPRIAEPAKERIDRLAYELYALRFLGAPKMVSAMALICPMIKDQETDMIINMDYEFTFLEFYEILLEAVRALILRRKTLEDKRLRKLAAEETALVSSLRTQSIQSTRSARLSNRPKSKKKL